MKKIILGLGLLLLGVSVYSQHGLENVIVEKYYVSDASDTMANAIGGVLPIGSITYRIYVDMLPGYELGAVYGVPGYTIYDSLNNIVTVADHEFRIATTTLFFNNESRGVTLANDLANNQLKNNTVMLDSWLSVGAASAGNFGILKAEDDGVATVVNASSPKVLQNADTAAGIPLKTRDGLIAGSPQTALTVGIDNAITVFGDQNDGTNGPVFSTRNGSLYSLYGAVGPDSIANKVLIAQLTTNGRLSFELNLQIMHDSLSNAQVNYRVTELYVAKKPVEKEIKRSYLTYVGPDPTSGIQDLNSSNKLRVYPNPIKDVFTMEVTTSKESKTASYVIYSMQGKTLLRRKMGTISGKYSENIDMSSFSPGQYLLEVTIDGISSAKKIIKIN